MDSETQRKKGGRSGTAGQRESQKEIETVSA